MAPNEQQNATSDQNQSKQNSLKSSIEEKMEIFCKSICIYKVPEEPSFDNRSVFVPVKVSIGPFHHGSSLLKQMEDLKWCYLCSFLKRGSAQQNYLKDIMDVIAESEKRVRQCYNVEFVMDSKEFNQMLLLDCCFILELLLRFVKNPKRRTDPIFTTPGLLFDLRCDMILLENQVPLFLLNDILEKHPISQPENSSLNDLAFRFFRRMIAGERQFLSKKFMKEADHFLDMVHYCFLSSYPRVETKDNTERKPLSSASILLKKGIQFKAASRNTKSLLDINFQNGVLEIPTFKVYQQSESILMNLIAYERCQFGTAQQVQSYVCLMSHLLESDKDVKLLCQRNILTDNENDKIAQNLKWMSQQKCLSDAYFAGVIQQIDESSCRCVGLGRMRIRTLIRNPFVIGVGAILVVGMIFVAAFFSAVTFLRHRYV